MELIAERESTYDLCQGVKLFKLKHNDDSRGCLMEINRKSWNGNTDFVQWNYVQSNKNVFRGTHVHPVHTDFLVLLTGVMVIGLIDLRETSATFNQSVLLELNPNQSQAILIPDGVMHGFYFPVASTHIYGVDEYWYVKDELGCHWEDTKGLIDWPFDTPEISERDANASSLFECRQALARAHGTRI